MFKSQLIFSSINHCCSSLIACSEICFSPSSSSCETLSFSSPSPASPLSFYFLPLPVNTPNLSSISPPNLKFTAAVQSLVVGDQRDAFPQNPFLLSRDFPFFLWLTYSCYCSVLYDCGLKMTNLMPISLGILGHLKVTAFLFGCFGMQAAFGGACKAFRVSLQLGNFPWTSGFHALSASPAGSLLCGYLRKFPVVICLITTFPL